MRKIYLIHTFYFFVIFCFFSCEQASEKKNTEWRYYGGDSGGSRYSELKQINTSNVNLLKLAWEYDTGELVDSIRPITNQCQPIVVNGVLYGTTARQKLFAVDAATGEKKWEFDPYAQSENKPRLHSIRGVVYWEKGKDKRILYGVGPNLLAVNADNGTLISDFGEQGQVDLHNGLGDIQTLGYDVNEFSIRSTSPGVIFKDLIIMGSSVSEGGDALPGYIRAYNVITGELAWVFHTIPLPGEEGYDTWAPDSYKKLGGANCWAGMVVDQKRGRVFLGTGSPSVDFYGGPRPGQNLFANCVISLNAKTGKRIWHFQTVHHDLWDKDLPCPPNLITVTHKGKKVDAVAQATKDGYVFIFNRDTGEPLFPVVETQVPVEPALPGEKLWSTQPIPSLPKPFASRLVTENDLTNRTPEAHEYVLKRFIDSDKGNPYMPPSEKGTLVYGFGGGAEWGGAAVDPNGIFYVNGNNMLWWLQMRKADDEKGMISGKNLFNQHCTACHSVSTKREKNGAYPNLGDLSKRMKEGEVLKILESGKNRMPSFQHLKTVDRKAIVDFLFNKEITKNDVLDVHKVAKVETKSGQDFPYKPPYLNNGNTQFLDPDGYPAVSPPWGTLNAIDMNSGEYLWQVPFGEFPELMKKGLVVTGTENHGGPIVTAGGLLFIAATYDEKLRAIDIKTGKTVWEYKLPAGGFSTPITYMKNGIQYIVISAGGARYGLKGGSKFLAFAIPKQS